MTIKFAVADICTALHLKTIGSKLRADAATHFADLLTAAISNYDTSNDKVEGQHFVHLPPAANDLVLCGVGKRTDNPDDYVIRNYREGPAMFLKREHAVETTGVACVVYTKQAYLDDPDITPEEAKRIERVTPGYTHVLVAVLAFGGPPPVVGPYRFVHNLAGGNHEYNLEAIVEKTWRNWEPDSQAREFAWETAFSDLVDKAKATKAYADEWKTVAD